MTRKFFSILSLFLSCSFFIFGETFPEKGKTVNDFIPKGWKILRTVKGDLNNDKLEDTAIVIEKDGTYVLTGKNDKGFIQSEGDEENPTLMDTLDEISIKNNILKINFNYVLSAGSWAASRTVYTFRFQNNRFELIGFDNNSYMRNSGEKEEFSVNFSTNKVKITTDGNISDKNSDKQKEEWKKVNIKKKYVLNEMTDGTMDEIVSYVY